MSMTLAQAIKQAEKFSVGEADANVLALVRLLEEVKKNDNPAAQVEEPVEVNSEFTVSIDDGYCEWSYPIVISEENSIHDIVRKLCDALSIETPDGVCRLAAEVESLPSAGPLNAYLLAGMADDLADQLADFAAELNLHHVQYETDARIMQTYVKWLNSIANQLRKE